MFLGIAWRWGGGGCFGIEGYDFDCEEENTGSRRKATSGTMRSQTYACAHTHKRNTCVPFLCVYGTCAGSIARAFVCLMYYRGGIGKEKRKKKSQWVMKLKETTTEKCSVLVKEEKRGGVDGEAPCFARELLT